MTAVRRRPRWDLSARDVLGIAVASALGYAVLVLLGGAVFVLVALVRRLVGP